MRRESYCTLATGIKPPRANFHSLRRFFMDSLGWSETQKCMYVVLTTKAITKLKWALGAITDKCYCFHSRENCPAAAPAH